jgi:hypothetical protein
LLSTLPLHAMDNRRASEQKPHKKATRIIHTTRVARVTRIGRVNRHTNYRCRNFSWYEKPVYREPLTSHFYIILSRQMPNGRGHSSIYTPIAGAGDAVDKGAVVCEAAVHVRNLALQQLRDGGGVGLNGHAQLARPAKSSNELGSSCFGAFNYQPPCPRNPQPSKIEPTPT